MKIRSALPMKVAKYGYILISVVFCISGILTMLYPAMQTSIMGYFFGIMISVFGVVKLIGFFSKDLFRLAFQYDLQFGILFCILGVITLIVQRNSIDLVCTSYGVGIIADSLFKCKTAFDAKCFGIRNWWLTLVLAIITALAGVTVTFAPAVSMRTVRDLLGISLLCEGALSLSVAIGMIKIIYHQRPDMIDAEIYEI